MITTPMDMKALTSDLTNSTWTLAAVGALYESGLAEDLREPRTIDELAKSKPGWPRGRIERLLRLAATTSAVVEEGGRWKLAPGAACFAQPPMRASMIGDVRSHLMQALAFLDSAAAKEQPIGWRFTDRAMLESQGDSSMALAGMMKMNLVPSLDGLAGRLERPGARVLDVGVGVGSLAMGLCRAFPAISVVGIDAAEAPLAIAKERVAKSGLGDRIELRRGPIESLSDRDVFDLVWLPSFFVAEEILPSVLARIHASMHEGAWMIVGTSAAPAATEKQQAVFSLVTDLWGGPVLTVSGAETLLTNAGFTSVRGIQGPPWAPLMFVARR
jgi:hypothetical protein